jgi:hypothetical protein
VALVTAWERQLNMIRDSAAFEQRPRKKAVRLLERLRDILSQGADLAGAASELGRLVEKKWLYLPSMHTFQPVRSDPKAEKILTLDQALCAQIGDRAAAVERVERLVRDLTVQYGTVLSARENIRLQRSVRTLTWILVILTIAMLWKMFDP